MAREEHRIVTVQVGTILLDVFAVYFPKHFATTTLLLPMGEKKPKNREADTLTTVQISVLSFAFLQGRLIGKSSGIPPVIPEIRRTERLRNGTYRFAVAQNAVHDAEGLPQIWMPRVLQRIKSTTERTSCLEKEIFELN